MRGLDVVSWNGLGGRGGGGSRLRFQRYRFWYPSCISKVNSGVAGIGRHCQCLKVRLSCLIMFGIDALAGAAGIFATLSVEGWGVGSAETAVCSFSRSAVCRSITWVLSLVGVDRLWIIASSSSIADGLVVGSFSVPLVVRPWDADKSVMEIMRLSGSGGVFPSSLTNVTSVCAAVEETGNILFATVGVLFLPPFTDVSAVGAGEEATVTGASSGSGTSRGTKCLRLSLCIAEATSADTNI